MAYDLDTIAEAIKTALGPLAADGVGCQAVAALPSNPTPPGAYVSDGDITFDLAMGRSWDEFTMDVTLLVGYGSDLAAQRRLRKLTPLVKSLIETDKTLGGLVDNARVTTATAPRLYGAEKPALGRKFTVQIYATP